MSSASDCPGCRFQHFQTWLVRKRVAISAITFGGLIALCVALGMRPREFAHGHDAWSLAAMTMVVLGLAIRSWAAGTLIKNKALTTTGPYRMVRNPLYSGSFLMMTGACLLVDQPLYPLAMVALILVIYTFTVRSEERRMAERFGDAWPNYARTTPRFVPRTLSFDFSDWRRSQWLKNREYAAVLATTAAFVAIEVWEHLSDLP